MLGPLGVEGCGREVTQLLSTVLSEGAINTVQKQHKSSILGRILRRKKNMNAGNGFELYLDGQIVIN